MEKTIYVLSNPITNEIFYVGCTKLSLKERLRAHYGKLAEANRGDINWNNRLLYLKKLLPHKASITLIDKCSDSNADFLEKKYIMHYNKLCQLTNQTKGGKGGDTYSLSSTASKINTSKLISDKLKGIKKPEGFSKNMSIKRTGYGNPSGGKTKFPPLVLESSNEILIFKNGIESNSYFENKYCWGNLISISKHNLANKNKRNYLKTYCVEFLTNVNANIKDIVESILEKDGNSYVYDKHTQKITVK
jgi:hypothetical protein